MVHDALAFGGGEQRRPQADEPAGRNLKLQMRRRIAPRLHALDLALALPVSSITEPTCRLGTSTTSHSIGPWSTPSISLMTTCGLPTASSKPSRRMVSSKMPRCSRPRPGNLELIRCAGVAADLEPRRCAAVALEPVANLTAGDVITLLPGERRVVDLEHHRQRRLIDLTGGRGEGLSGSAMVSPISTLSRPTIPDVPRVHAVRSRFVPATGTEAAW